MSPTYTSDKALPLNVMAAVSVPDIPAGSVSSTVPIPAHASSFIRFASTRMDAVAGTVLRGVYAISWIVPFGAPLSGLVMLIELSSTSTTKTFGSTGWTSSSSLIMKYSVSGVVDVISKSFLVIVRRLTVLPATLRASIGTSSHSCSNPSA